MDLRQVVRYSAPTRAAALARAGEDLALARAAGFEVVGSPDWDDRRVSQTLVVALRYAPPDALCGGGCVPASARTSSCETPG